MGVSESWESERQGVEQALSYYSDNLDFTAYSEKPSMDAIYNLFYILKKKNTSFPANTHTQEKKKKSICIPHQILLDG